MPDSVVTALLGDLDVFESKYWQRRPYRHSPDDVAIAAEILSLEDADRIFASPSARPPYVEIKHQGNCVRERRWTRQADCKTVSVPDSVSTQALAAEFSRGATLILNNLDDHRHQVRAVCRAFEAAFRAPTKSVAFITPASQPGLGLHLDTFEGFILQTHGAKTWYIYDQILPLTHKSRGLRPDEVGEPSFEVTLYPGDCLYVPWGAPHRAVSRGNVSCHVTFMCRTPSWDRTLADLIAAQIPEAAHDRIPLLATMSADEFAAGLAGYLEDLATATSQGDAGVLAADEVRRRCSQAPGRAGFIGEASRLAGLTMTARVTRRGAAPYSAAKKDGDTLIQVSGRTLRVRGDITDALSMLDEVADLPISDLPGSSGESGLLAIMRRLAQFDVIRVLDRAPEPQEA